jgi:signal transduction histidine kinase
MSELSPAASGPRRRFTAITASRPVELSAGLAFAAVLMILLSVCHYLTVHYWSAPVLALTAGGALAESRRKPVFAAAITAAALVTTSLSGQTRPFNGPLDIVTIAPLALAYGLGSRSHPAVGLAGAVTLAAAMQTTGTFNPLFEMITLGPWVTGRVLRSRRLLLAQLEERNTELGAEREAFARESIRFERAKIARELHDIVAHCVTVMVVQAGAGQRLIARAPDAVATTFDAICEAAAQAHTEVGRLVALLVGEPVAGPGAGYGPGPDAAGGPGAAARSAVEELARRARAAGLPVTCHFAGPLAALAPDTAEIAYRVVQESLTNALKHAPGAAVAINLRTTGATPGDQPGRTDGTGAEVASGIHVEVDVTNAAPPSNSSGLEHSGGGRGLAGMRDRIADCGGRLTTGATAEGGWRVLAQLPGTLPPPTISADAVDERAQL